jgi:hypothetical protein
MQYLCPTVRLRRWEKTLPQAEDRFSCRLLMFPLLANYFLSYTPETSAAFQYDEMEVRLVPKKLCVIWDLFFGLIRWWIARFTMLLCWPIPLIRESEAMYIVLRGSTRRCETGIYTDITRQGSHIVGRRVER